MRRGDCRALLGHHEAARDDFEKVQQTTPKSEWWSYYWDFLIFGYRQLGDVETAETLAREWTVQCPKTPDPHQLLAEIYAKQQRWDEALQGSVRGS